MQLLCFLLWIPPNVVADSMITQSLKWTYLQRLVRQPIKNCINTYSATKKEKKTSNSRTLPWVQCYFKRGELQREEKCVKRVSFISNSLWLPFWIFIAFHCFSLIMYRKKMLSILPKKISIRYSQKMCTSRKFTLHWSK